MQRYAWLPKIVFTWRPSHTRALIWMQSYHQEENGDKYCTHLGYFSHEFSGPLFSGFR